MEKWEKDIEQMNTLIDSFYDTCEKCASDTWLIESIANSIMGQRIIPEGSMETSPTFKHKKGEIKVTTAKTLEAAAKYKDKKVAVLNFASALYPGGGHAGQSLTQEECLCRETTLFPCISTDGMKEQFYKPHKTLGWEYNGDMIYTPGVAVFKTYDKFPVLMDVADWFNVDVITMAAPNISLYNPKDDEMLVKIFQKRFRAIADAAQNNGVDVLILGAFGCGEFGNDPAVVATAAARTFDHLRHMFDTVEFAIYEAGKRKKNYRMFRLVLDRYLSDQS